MNQNYLDIANYSFQKDIGEGNFGKVKLGVFKPTGEEFAIKILNKSKIKIKMKNTIFKENDIITKFNHINVIYVFQILEDSQNFYIIMEYCKHGELFDYIVKNEKLSEEESSIFFYQLINGIEYIHSKGISHRDLKPENLLLAEDKILKIIDFGLSHEFEGDELLKTKCGSPSYAAPEIICCPFYDGFKVDVWCCGIILYAMLCGYLPFEGEDNNVLFQNILNCDPEFPSFLSELSKDIILKILNPEPEYRITIDEIKKHEFYLKGKKLCNIDYDTIENNIIKKRNIFTKSKLKNLLYLGNRSDTNINDNNLTNDEKYFITANCNNDKKKINNDSNYYLDEKSCKIRTKNKNNNNSLKNLKNTTSSKAFKRKIKDINTKFSKRIDTITNKIQNILKTDVNDNNKFSSRPFSSQKNIHNNYKANVNKNIVTTSNIPNNNIVINKKDPNSVFADLISNFNENNKTRKNSLFIRVLDSAKNKYFNLYKQNEKLGFKYNTNRFSLTKNDYQNKKSNNNKSKTKDSTSFFKNFSNNSPKNTFTNHYEIKNNNNQKRIISLSNDNLNDIEKYHKTCNNKGRYNLFKEIIRTEKNKSKHCFNIKRALSKCENNINDKNKNSQTLKSPPKVIKKNSSQNNSTKDTKTRPLNFYAPNSTLYYNNININIKELNINSKTLKNPKTNIISSLVSAQRIKSPTHSKKNNDFNSNENKNYIKNKAFSAKRLISYNINTNNIHNLKSNINSNINKMNKYTNGNLYTISNNNKGHFFISTINNYETNNNINGKMTKYKNNLFGLSKNIKFVSGETNFKSFKNKNILKTEPKEMLKKQFSFNKTITNRFKDDVHIQSEVNDKYLKNDKKRSKSERMNKCKTINTDEGRARLKNVNKNGNMNKKYSQKNLMNEHGMKKKTGNKYNTNNIDDLFLYMFLEQKLNYKNNKLITQNSFKKWNK